MFVVVVTRKQTNNINLLTTVHQCTSLNEYLLSSPLLVHFLFHETLAEEMASTLNVQQKMADRNRGCFYFQRYHGEAKKKSLMSFATSRLSVEWWTHMFTTTLQ